MSQKGQSLIEFVVALCVAPAVLSLTAVALYCGLCQVTLEQQLYENMICRISRQNPSRCRNQAQRKIKTILPFGELKELYVSDSSSSCFGRVQFRLYKQDFEIEKTLDLPLKVETKRL